MCETVRKIPLLNGWSDVCAGAHLHGWFTVAADNHSKHEVCAQDKTIITAALAGKGTPGSAGWDTLPCDIMHQDLPANCAQNVEPGLPLGYEPRIPDDPEQTSEPGFKLLGFGACRDSNQRFPPWGNGGHTNTQCATKCRGTSNCVAYMSTQNEEPSMQYACQYYCKAVSALCPTPGTADGATDKLTTTDGSQDGSLLRFCWLKDAPAGVASAARTRRAPWHTSPWIHHTDV